MKKRKREESECERKRIGKTSRMVKRKGKKEKGYKNEKRKER